MLAVGMSFDTTASNSGNKAGACVLLESMLNKPLLNLACRHHIHELIIAKVFETVIDRASSCPQIKLLQRFATAWNTINAHVFESAISDDQLATELDPIKKDKLILDFLKKQLRTFQPRDDYKELLHLGILFLISSNTPILTHLIIHLLHLNDTHLNSYSDPSWYSGNRT